MPSDSGTTAHAQFAERMTTLIQRMEAQPEVSAVTFADAIPGAEGRGVIEPDSPVRAHPFTRESRRDQPVRRIRRPCSRRAGFAPLTRTRRHPRSSSTSRPSRIVWRQDGNVIGRRIRFTAPDGRARFNPWMEIVGVVPVFSSTFTPP